MTKTKESIGSCIIVGGGLGGIHVARTIAKTAGGAVDITVVDRQNYLDWCLASPRMLVQPDDIQKFGYVMPLDKVCEFVAGKKANIQFVQGAVAKIGAKSVTLENGTTLQADVIVVAVGGQYASGALWKPLPDQITMETRIAGFRTLHDKVAAAKSILVKGAGPTGVEVAGEIKAAFPETTVTMVGTVLPSSLPAQQARMKAALEGMGVIVQEGRVDASEPDQNGTVKTRDGETIENVDLILDAAGFVFRGMELADDSLQKDVTDRGQFNCRPTLQLQSVDSVFCCGDILAVPEGCYADVKGSLHADMTAETVGKNVVLLLQQKKPLQNFKWSKKPITKPMMTALGPNTAVGFVGLPSFMENWMAKTFKCTDYYMSIKGSTYGKGKTWHTK